MTPGWFPSPCAPRARQSGWRRLGLALLVLLASLMPLWPPGSSAEGMPACHEIMLSVADSGIHAPSQMPGHASLSAPCCQLWLLPALPGALPILALALGHPPIPRRQAFRSRSEPPLGKPPRSC